MGEDIIEVPRSESKWGAVLGMMLSGGLSIFIAFAVFMIGVVHEDRLAERELRGLVQFMAVEATDAYAEAVEAASQLMFTHRLEEMVSPQILDAQNIGQALALEADPQLAGAVRTIFGGRESLKKSLGKAHAFYSENENNALVHTRKILAICTQMSGSIDVIFAVARDIEVDATVLAALEATHKEAREKIASFEVAMADHVPDVLVSDPKDLGIYSGHGSSGCTGKATSIYIENWHDMPIKITAASTTLEGASISGPDSEHPSPVGVTILPEKHVYLGFDFPRWPQLPRGRFERNFVVETSCPGYERIEEKVIGTVEHLYVECDRNNSWRRSRKGYYLTDCLIWNTSERAVTVKSVTCTVPNAEVILPDDMTIPVTPRDTGKEKALKVRLKVMADNAAEARGVKGSIVIETDLPGYERVETELASVIP